MAIAKKRLEVLALSDIEFSRFDEHMPLHNEVFSQTEYIQHQELPPMPQEVLKTAELPETAKTSAGNPRNDKADKSRRMAGAPASLSSLQMVAITLSSSIALTAASVSSGGTFLPSLGELATSAYLAAEEIVSYSAPDSPASIPDEDGGSADENNDSPSDEEHSEESQNGEASPPVDAPVVLLEPVPIILQPVIPPSSAPVIPEVTPLTPQPAPAIPDVTPVIPQPALQPAPEPDSSPNPSPPPTVPHAHSYTSSELAPTCTEDGTITYTCNACGDSYNETTPATGHSYTAVAIMPTCTANGTTTYTCDICGDSYSETTPATGHSYTAVAIMPTCTANGTITYTCDICGDSYSETTPATGHSFDSWTDNTDGTHEGVCEVCGDTQSEPHTWSDTGCTKCGAMVSLFYDSSSRSFTVEWVPLAATVIPAGEALNAQIVLTVPGGDEQVQGFAGIVLTKNSSGVWRGNGQIDALNILISGNDYLARFDYVYSGADISNKIEDGINVVITIIYQ